MSRVKVTLIPGDGVGPECIESARKIIDATGAAIDWEIAHAGASVFKQGIPSGVPEATIQSINKTRLVLKGPLETPVGFGEKSANVTLRKLFETYGNIRPVRGMPGVPTPYSDRHLDLVIVRENVEDLYAGIEHMQTPGVAQCLKLISKKGCEKIVRLAFEFARSEGRKKVHCATKANIMKLTEGLLKRTFEEIAPEYPDIEANHIIVDNCAHQLVKKPEQFEVIVTTNMNGDILSDLTSALVGGLGFAPSANLGSEVAIFEAVHGSAPKYAGKNNINPTAVIMSGVLMLRHLKMLDQAAAIENSILHIFEEGKVRTRDVVSSAKEISTTEFTDLVIQNLGRAPKTTKIRDYKPMTMPRVSDEVGAVVAKKRKLLGVDIFVESVLKPDVLGESLLSLSEGMPLKLKMISNRGTRVFPWAGGKTGLIDHYRTRFIAREETTEVSEEDIMKLLTQISKKHTWCHIEKLQEFDGIRGFSKAQGED